MKLPVSLLALTLVGALRGTDAKQVTIRTFAFAPKALEVPVGATVVWTNADDIEHTVTSGAPDHADGGFDYSLATKGAVASTRFDSVGTWSYYCKRHSFMRGEIRVIPKGER
ncbi:MAG TPA: plastocyanin/azurin family copper-binding protein [Gemmatimonadales bacterium]|jgi:plastocyanin|nr:plastocyanin/azurin family copper-binding protein [Gemmatimonadales bacterium]